MERKKYVFPLFAVCLLTFGFLCFLPGAVSAANDAGRERVIDQLAKDQTVGGPGFFGGDVVQVDGTVHGTAFAVGENIQVNGTINGDLFVFGKTVVINGTVNGNIYAAGQNLVIGAQATGDVFLAGQTIAVSKQSACGRDLFTAAQTALIEGAVKRHLFGSAAQIGINNTIGGDLRLDASSIRLMGNARVEGDFHYQSAQQATLDPGAQIKGEAAWDYEETGGEPTAASPLKGFRHILWSMAQTVPVWLLITLLWPNFWPKTSRIIKEQPLKTVGIGALAFFLAPLATVILFFTVVGIPLGILAAAVYCLILFLAKTITAVFLGSLIADRLHWPSVHKGVWLFLLGLFLLNLLLTIPVAGAILWLPVFFIGFGSLLLLRKTKAG